MTDDLHDLIRQNAGGIAGLMQFGWPVGALELDASGLVGTDRHCHNSQQRAGKQNGGIGFEGVHHGFER